MKYYVISDIHSHCKEMVEAINKSGFDVNDSDSKLLLIGDAFDRGKESYEVYRYLLNLINQNKLIWIIGNHEFQLLNILRNDEIKVHNHTYKTMLDIASGILNKTILTDEEILTCLKDIKLKELLEDNLLPFYSTGKHIFTHGFLPNKNGKIVEDWDTYSVNKMWKYLNQNGMKKVFVEGLKIEGKVIVCGHVKCSYGNVRKSANPKDFDKKEFSKLENNYKDLSLFEPFISDNVIGIDGCVCNTNHLNCIVLEDK